ncbi:hypothetical protein C5167_035178 [Papaver somniferum]|uniref:NAD(P)H dehydrogenase (quinone) n=1 Tax=Papaver somniferum TaxID=3469 RepID=A0A4Y7KF83_PAPSO|nr:hypothetical protein C5167_035178 [Papaver somniferum]
MRFVSMIVRAIRRTSFDGDPDPAVGKLRMEFFLGRDTPQVVPIWKAKVGGAYVSYYTVQKEDPAMFWLTQLSGLMHSIYIQVPEEVLGKMGAPPKTDVPIITPNNLADADGLIFGFPTRFGMIEAQFKAFLDTQGVESNHSVIHHGLIYVLIGLTFEAGMFEMVQVKGGTPYGAGIFAGDGPRQPTERELGRAFH